MYQTILAESRNPASRFWGEMRDPAGMVAEMILRNLAETLYTARIEVDFGAGLQTRSWYMDRLMAFLRFGIGIKTIYNSDHDIQVKLVDHPDVLVMLGDKLTITYTVGAGEEAATLCRQYLADVEASKKWKDLGPPIESGRAVTVRSVVLAYLSVLG